MHQKFHSANKDQSLEIMMSLYSDQQAWIKGKTIEEANENLKKFVKNKNFTLDFEKCISDKKIESVKNEKIKKSLIELTKVFREK